MFDLEQVDSDGRCFDSLLIYNKTSDVTRLCGQYDADGLRHLHYVTTGAILRLHFVSDYKRRASGFRAVYYTDEAQGEYYSCSQYPVGSLFIQPSLY